MNSETIFVLLQLYGLTLIVMLFVFFRGNSKIPGKFIWMKLFGVATLDLLAWALILVVGGFVFKNEQHFFVYFLVSFFAKGLIATFLLPIKPIYMNFIYFSPPIISGVVLGAMVSRR